MYKIDSESIDKLLKINALLNQLEIKGNNNINILYTIMISMNQVLQKVQEYNRDTNSSEKVVIENDIKGGK
jgi:hypothetical protein